MLYSTNCVYGGEITYLGIYQNRAIVGGNTP